jgi:hypothetical protein
MTADPARIKRRRLRLRSRPRCAEKIGGQRGFVESERSIPILMSSNDPTIPTFQIVAVGGVSQTPKGFGARYRASNIGAPLPILALTVLTLIWGASVPMMKLGLGDLSPLTLVSWRYVCAAPLFGLLLLGRKLPGRKVLASVAGMAAFGLTAGQILQIIGIGFSSAAIATIITGTIPIFTVLLGALRLGQSVRARYVFSGWQSRWAVSC